MSVAVPMFRYFFDRLTPMSVKEMRQGLRTRIFTLALMLDFDPMHLCLEADVAVSGI
ncbi:MAG: hypothetical protein RL015_2240 [Verrucomicrobiota bacterium]|jgi:hypothetical protein